MNDASPPKKPTLRLLHHMACSGGTLISRRLGSMQGVCLLSEIPHDTAHPKAKSYQLSPLKQAVEWHGLLDPQDLEIFRKNPPSFQQIMWLIEERASAHGLQLLVRDWSHMDWIGKPSYQPVDESRLADWLQDYIVHRHCTVRHPIDQYLSLFKLGAMPDCDGTIDAYLEGMLKFSEWCHEIGFTRYEDLTHEPDTHLKHICEQLALDFAPSPIDRRSSFKHVTSDLDLSRGGAAAIRHAKRRAAPDELIDQFRSRETYSQIKQLLGYETD